MILVAQATFYRSIRWNTIRNGSAQRKRWFNKKITYPVYYDIIRFFRQVKVSQSFFISLTILVVARFEKTRR